MIDIADKDGNPTRSVSYEEDADAQLRAQHIDGHDYQDWDAVHEDKPQGPAKGEGEDARLRVYGRVYRNWDEVYADKLQGPAETVYDRMRQNEKPFGLLSPEEQAVLRDVEELEYYSVEGWTSLAVTRLYPQVAYRLPALPEPALELPWDALDDMWQWAALTRFGAIFLSEYKPYAVFEDANRPSAYRWKVDRGAHVVVNSSVLDHDVNRGGVWSMTRRSQS